MRGRNGGRDGFSDAKQKLGFGSFPPNWKALKNQWIYQLKDEGKNQKWYKARLVVKGFDQKKCIKFNEIFSPMVKMTTI